MYTETLINFQPKIHSMVRNLRSCGYRFDGHDDDDLVQELLVCGLEVRDTYDATRSAVKTFLYQSFRWRLLELAESSDHAMLWAISIDNIDLPDRGPWRNKARTAVSKMMVNLKTDYPDLFKICDAVMDNGGNKNGAARSLGVSRWFVTKAMTDVRKTKIFCKTIDFIPF